MNPLKGLNEFVEELLTKRRVSLVVLAVFSLLVILALSGCASLKEAGWVSGVGLATGAAASVATGTLPAIAAGAGAAGITAAVISDAGAAPTSAATATSAWGALAVLFQTSGKWLGICALTCILLGWLLPGPLKLHERRREKAD
jgi:hypothetical protein